MLRRRVLGASVTLAAAAVFAAAGCASASAGAGADAGGDTATPVESGPGDALATDGSDAGGCAQHLPAGFSQVVASQTVANASTGDSNGRSVAMALDENDDPMVAYVDTGDGTNESIMFVRWDPCAGTFATPIKVDGDHAFGGSIDVALAYDPSTKEVGIAYVRGDTYNNWADGFAEVFLATMKAPATTFTTQMLSLAYVDACPGTVGPVAWSAASPAIAMQGGKIFVAYAQSKAAGYSAPLAWFLSSTSAGSSPEEPEPSADGGFGGFGGVMEAGVPDAGAGGPHAFSYTAVPFDGTPPNNVMVCGSPFAGYAWPHWGSPSMSLAVDATGAPGLAMYEETGNGYGNYRALFWRPGMAEASVAYDFNVDASPDLTLVFDGTKPRIAGHMDAGDAGADTLTFLSSSDGMTWSAPLHLPPSGSSFDSALATDGMGHLLIAADRNATNPNCPANPVVATSSDDGMTWTVACPDTADAYGFSAYSITAAYGASRLKGTPAVAFLNTNTNTVDAGPSSPGIVYWQHP